MEARAESAQVVLGIPRCYLPFCQEQEKEPEKSSGNRHSACSVGEEEVESSPRSVHTMRMSEKDEPATEGFLGKGRSLKKRPLEMKANHR